MRTSVFDDIGVESSVRETLVADDYGSVEISNMDDVPLSSDESEGLSSYTITPTSTEPADKIDRAYDATTEKGKLEGLFRTSMTAIRSSHHEARAIRTALILLGLFTDKILYRDWTTVFYYINNELEIKMQCPEFEASLQDEKEIKILNKLQKLGDTYYFNNLYEKDLYFLYGVSLPCQLKKKVETCLQDKPGARKFRDHIRKMTTASELSGALFCLWGVFIVGGGAMARQRAIRMVGEKGVNVYQNVSGPGREMRKRDFINLWDGLAEAGSSQFKSIENSSDECMKLMNASIKDMSANPWWLKHVCITMTVLVVLAAIIWEKL